LATAGDELTRRLSAVARGAEADTHQLRKTSQQPAIRLSLARDRM
jgi:hypothetical protein